MRPEIAEPPAVGPALPWNDAACAEPADLLWKAGFAKRLAGFGLTLWQSLRAKTRGGDRLFLTVGLPPYGPVAAIDAAARAAELERRLAAAEPGISLEASRILRIAPDRVAVTAAPIESCCGARCESCLVTKGRQARRWVKAPQAETLSRS